MRFSENCEKYFAQCISANSDQNFFHRSLLSATFDVALPEPPLREHSICYGEIPVTYSIKYSKASQAPGFRMVLEPGGIGIDVARQVDWSLRTLDGILSKLRWYRVADSLNGITPIIYPKNAEETCDWHGGMWLGMEASNHDQLNLKVYMNLRYGNTQERWQRIATVVSSLAKPSIELAIRKIISDTEVEGIPVGIGLNFGHEGLKGIRLYICMFQPDGDIIANLCDSFFPKTSAVVKNYCHQFEQEFGKFKDQSVTLGYDFAISSNGYLTSCPVRFKAELGCFALNQEQQKKLPDWFDKQLVRLGIKNHNLDSDLTSMKSSFPSYIPQYSTIGVSDEIDHLTLYLEPRA